jgi:iron complex transport system substrate-binding protein
MRIISLLASATEIVCSLGAGDMLVGRSHECDNPPWVRQLPACSEPAFDVSVSSVAIDTEVRRRLRAAEPLYILHNELIAGLHADRILTQEHCEVCAITPEDVARSGACAMGMQQLALSAFTLADIFDGILKIARAIGREDAGLALVAREQARLEAVRTAAARFPRKSVVLMEWTEPIFAMGNWGPELIEAANGELLLGHKGEYSSAIAAGALRAADPEYLIVAPCGFSLERSLAEQATLERLPFWRELRAVREGKVAFANGNLYFNRSGMTVVNTAEIIAEILHGKPFAEKTEGEHWRWMVPSAVAVSA